MNFFDSGKIRSFYYYMVTKMKTKKETKKTLKFRKV